MLAMVSRWFALTGPIFGTATSKSNTATRSFGNGRRFRVLDVVPFDEDESPLVGMLKVEMVVWHASA